MKFDSLKSSVREKQPSLSFRDVASEPSILICVDIQEGIEMDGLHWLDLARIIASYKKTFMLLDSIVDPEPQLPEALMEALNGSLPDNVIIVEKEYGGFLSLSVQLGLYDAALAFFSDARKNNASTSALHAAHASFIGRIATELRENNTNTALKRMTKSIPELVSGLDEEFISEIDVNHVDLCGNKSSMKEIELLLRIKGIHPTILQPFTY